jgi:glycosyltransferase involved in cell wall biosynthesis
MRLFRRVPDLPAPGAPSIADITVVVVNFRTLEHLRRCRASLRTAYPAIALLLVDNGSADASTSFVREAAADDTHTRAILNPENRFHGPALEQAIRAATTRYVFLLDSDCELLHDGFLEPMLDAFVRDARLYAIGKQGWTNRYGYAPVSAGQARAPYIHPFAALLDRDKHLALGVGFVHHGAPGYRTMWAAQRAGLRCAHIPVEDHVLHHGRVTANAHGYGYDRRLVAQLRANRLDHGLRRIAARARGRTLQPPALPAGRSTGE